MIGGAINEFESSGVADRSPRTLRGILGAIECTECGCEEDVRSRVEATWNK